MATEALSSNSITNRDAVPAVLNSPVYGVEFLRSLKDFVTIVTGKTVGSTYRILTVPAAAFVRDLFINNPALSASTAFDIGVYKNTQDGGAVVDADFFASAVACTNLNMNVSVVNESGTYTVDKQSQPLWQAVGMSAAPASGFLDIVATNTATNAAGGLLGLHVKYVI